MKFSKLPLGLVFVLLIMGILPMQTLAQSFVKRQGYCERGGQRVNTNGASSTTTVQQSLPSCTVTVYLTGTTTPASLFSDASGATPLANPLTADATGYYSYYAATGTRVDERFSGGTAPNNIASPFTKTDILIGGSLIIQNQGTTLSPQRNKLNLEWPFLVATDDSTNSATKLNASRTPTGQYNAILDLGMSGDPRLWSTTAIIPAGATTVTLTGSIIDDNLYPPKYRNSPQTHTFKVGQGIRIPRGGDSCCDYVGTITGVSGNVLTFSPATTTSSVDVDFIVHDETKALADFITAHPNGGTIQFPDGGYQFSSYYDYTAGKDYAISLPLNSEGTNQQWAFIGQGKFRSMLFHSGPGHLFRQAGVRTINTKWQGLYMAHVSRYSNQALAIDTTGNYAGAALYLQSNQFSGGVPQSDATAILVDDCMILGWRDGVMSDNLQSSKISNTSFYYNANSVTLLGSNTVRGIGSQTEPNVNKLSDLFIQYGQPLTGNLRTGTGGAATNSSTAVTCSGCSFTDSDLYRVISIPGAGVNGTTHFATIIAVGSSTAVTISQPPWTSVTGQTLTIYQAARGHVFAQNAANLKIDGGTFQGSWISPGNLANHGIWLLNCYSPTIDGLWIEDSGGTAGAAIKFQGTFGAQIKGTSFKGDNPGGYGTGLYLDAVNGLSVDGSYIGQSGAAQDIVAINGTKGVKFDNSTIASASSAFGSTTDTTQNFWPFEFGQGMRYLNSSESGGMTGTELLNDSTYSRQLLTNGNFANAGTGWTLTAPGALTFTAGSPTIRGSRYVTVAPTTGGGNVYAEQMAQTISIDNAIQSLIPVTVGFDWQIVSRGADAIPSAPTYNELRVKLIFSNGDTLQESFDPSASIGRITGRWNRASITSRIPAGTSRTIKIQIEAGQGTNAAVFRLANFRLTYGTRATFDDDEPITELQGGTFQSTAVLTFLAGAGGGTQTVCVNNAGLITFGVCGGGGGGGGTVTSVGYSLGTSGSDLNFSGTASPITTTGAFVLNVPNAGVGVRGVIPGSGSQTIGATWTLSSLLTTTGLQPAVDNVSMVGDTNLRYTAGHFGSMGVQSHGDATNTRKLTISNNGTKSFVTSDGASALDVLVGSNGISLDTSGVGTAVGTGGFNTSVLVAGQVSIARGGTNTTSASYSTNGAFYYDGTKFITTATGGAGTLCLVSTNGAAPTFGSCAGSAATALSSITAATGTNTINSGDNSQIWKWTLTTSGGTGFRISENSASGALGTPHLIAIDTLSTSTVNPLQVTAQGTANGIRVDTAGLLSRIGTGHIRATQVYIDNIGAGAFYIRYLANETLSANRDLLIKVNDGNKTIDLGGNLTFGGAFTTTPSNALTFTTTGSTNVTLPTSGTLIGGSSLANTQVVFANSASTVTSSSALTWSGAVLTASATVAGPLGVSLVNPSTNSAATTEIDFANSANSLRFGITGSSYSGAPYSANQVFFESTGLTNGFVFNADSSARFSYLFNGTENSRLTSTGLCLGCTSPDGRLKITAASGDEAIKIGSYAPTAGSNVSAIDLTGTWNDGASAFVAPIKVNMTDTASDAATNLLTMQVGGVDVFNIRKGGTITTGHTFSGTNTFTGANTFSTSTNVFSSRAEFSNFYLDAPGLFNLRIVPGATLTADRTLTITTPTGSNATWNVQGNLGLGGDLNSSAAVTLGTHALTFVTSGTTNATLPSGTSTLLSADSTNTVTNKTIEAGSNVILLPSKANFIAGGCNVSTAGAGFDTPSTGGATAVCIGTTNTSGLLQFADAATQVATAHFRLPSDWTSTGGVDFNIIYTGDTSSTNNIRYQASCACVADGEDLIAPSYMAASANSFAGPATAGLRKTATLSGMTITNCAAGETMYIKLERLGSDGADTYAGNARVLELEVTYWRSM